MNIQHDVNCHDALGHKYIASVVTGQTDDGHNYRICVDDRLARISGDRDRYVVNEVRDILSYRQTT